MFVFLYYILIFSQSVPKDIQHVRKSSAMLLEEETICSEEVWDSCHHIGGGSDVQMDALKVMAVTDWARPTSRRELQRFIGFGNFLVSLLQAGRPFGVRCNTALIKQRFWWPMMNREIQDFGEGLFGMRKEQVSQPTPCWPFAIPSRSKKIVVSHRPRFCYWPATLSGKHCGSQCCRTNFKSCSSSTLS